MAHKIKEGLREMKDSVVEKIKGPKYYNNLLGESLPELLRRATSKTLFQPDDEMNDLVVETINQEVQHGRDPRDVVFLLKQRLSMDNPTKQWLAVHLVRKVLHGCRMTLGLFQEDLLKEVAKVMARPSRPDTEIGRKARHAAKELLREFGRAGVDAFRATRGAYGRPMGFQPVGAPGGGGPYPPSAAYEPGMAVHVRTGVPVALSTHVSPHVNGMSAGGSSEAASLVQELRGIMDQARANAELLQELLSANTDPKAVDEFERNLISDLTVEVRELRGLLTAYVEQLQRHSGADVETAMAEALGLSELLDRVLTKETKAPGAAASAPAAAAPKAAEPSLIDAPSLLDTSAEGSAPAAKHVAAKSQDLISFDLASSSNARVENTAKDPFALPVPAHPPLALPAPSLPPINFSQPWLGAPPAAPAGLPVGFPVGISGLNQAPVHQFHLGAPPINLPIGGMPPPLALPPPPRWRRRWCFPRQVYRRNSS